MMRLILMIAATFWAGYVDGFTMEQFDAWEAEWKEFQCGPHGEMLMIEGWNCPHLEPKEITDAFDDCEHKTFPHKKAVDFGKAACEDRTIFEEYDKCINEYKKDPLFVKAVEQLDAAIECYGKWLAGHGLETKLLEPK